MSTRTIVAGVVALAAGLGGVVLWALTDDDGADGSVVAADLLVVDEAPATELIPDDTGVTTATPTVGTEPTPAPSPEPTPGPTPEPTAEPTATPEPTPSDGTVPAGWLRCTNPIHGWEIAYPPDWHVYDDTVYAAGQCGAFAPFDLAGLDFEAAMLASEVFVGVLEMWTLDEYRSEFIEGGSWIGTPVVEAVTVAGRPAWSYYGLVPEWYVDERPWRLKEYAVDVTHLARPGVLYLMAMVPDESGRYPEAARVLDTMADSLRLPPA